MWGKHRYRITKEIAIHLTRIIRELVTIFSKQQNIVLEQKLRVLLSSEGFMQPGPGLLGTIKWLFGPI